jgi:chemotaxis regulatin CheY-phosphate phosphatase CheZ
VTDTPRPPRLLAEHGLEGVYDEMMPHWNRHLAGEITIEQYRELWRSCWNRYLSASENKSTEGTTWTP